MEDGTGAPESADTNKRTPQRRKRLAGIIAGVLAFALLFSLVQTVLTPKYLQSSSGMAYGLYHGLARDTEYLFLGTSQAYAAVDARELTESYGLNAYDFGSGGLPFAIMPYFLSEFLRYEHPQYVFAEVSTILRPVDEITDQQIAYCYAPFRPSAEKRSSLRLIGFSGTELLARDAFPIFIYHNRWDSLELEDAAYLFFPLIQALRNNERFASIPAVAEVLNNVLLNRGHLAIEKTREARLVYEPGGSGSIPPLPAENAAALEQLADLCRARGVTLILFKTPTPQWTAEQSAAAAAAAAELGIEYLELHDYLDEIGIDAQTDFADGTHLNASGAAKVTAFMAHYIRQELPLSP